MIKPYGTGHFLNGVSVSGNKFRSLNGSIDRVERVDTSFSDLNLSRSKDVLFQGNTFHGVSEQVANPLRVKHAQASAASTWTVDSGGLLPFGGEARFVESIVALGPVRTGGNSNRYVMPYAEVQRGPDRDQVELRWPEALKGEVQVVMRMDA